MSTGELIVIGVVVVIIFSAARMGALGNALGRFVYSFRKAARGGDLIDGKARRVDRMEVEDGQIIDAREEPKDRPR